MPIRNPLFYSLLLNGVLVGTLGYREFLTPRAMHIAQAQPLPAIAPQSVPVPSEEEKSPSPAQRPFQWSDLESADYPTYIANLRKIGCPEPTVRDILAADLDALYAQKRSALAVEGGSPLAQQRALAALQEEEIRLLNRLLGTPLSPAEPSAVAQEQASPPPVSAAVIPASRSPQQATVAVPLAFQPLNSEEVKLNDHQKVLLEDLRQTFIQEIGGPHQDPKDPLYLTRWQQAKADADSQLETLFGKDIYAQYQVASSLQGRE